jgi:hypothetical protein
MQRPKTKEEKEIDKEKKDNKEGSHISDTQTDRQIDRQAGRQTDRETISDHGGIKLQQAAIQRCRHFLHFNGQLLHRCERLVLLVLLLWWQGRSSLQQCEEVAQLTDS